MNNHLPKAVVMLALMLASAYITNALTPKKYLANTLPSLNLSDAIPTHFGEWQEQKLPTLEVINPQLETVIKKIYSQTLSRVYVNNAGQRVMLSIAYGKDQGDFTQVHQPEVCYPAQGFKVTSNRLKRLETPYGAINLRHLETNLANDRYEPVIYWTTVGDKSITSGINKKLAEIEYRIDGLIPDGLLFRVSSIDRDTQAAFLLQSSFVRDLVENLSPDLKKRIAGLNGSR